MSLKITTALFTRQKRLFKMEVELSKKSGFCFGVKRAVDLALKIDKKCNTIGPLIQNPLVVEELKQKGITPVKHIRDIRQSMVLIRAHGVPKSTIEKIQAKGCRVIDLTCPFVKKIQDYAAELEKKGYFIIIIGEKNHPEVEAIVGNLRNVAVVENSGQLKDLKDHKKVGVLVQTTQMAKLFKETVKEIKKKYSEVKVCNTICNATDERQKAAAELSKRSDIMIVVGGRNSANTKKLAELCSSFVETHHIETASELKKEWFVGKKKAAVSSGASTPKEAVDIVLRRIKNEF